MTYQQRIAAIAPDANARHVEAMMRIEHETLDGLSPIRFAREVLCCQILAEADPQMAEALARSYGL